MAYRQRRQAAPQQLPANRKHAGSPAAGVDNRMMPYYEHAGITIYHGDCREILPQLPKVDAVITDPPYGVGLSAKRAKQRGGGVSVRVGSYSFDDNPEYIAEVVVPVIAACISRARRVALTPGTRNAWTYPKPDDMGCFYSAAGTGMGKWGFTCSQPILFYGSDPYLENSLGSRANSCGQTYPNDANDVEHPCAKPIAMMLWLVNRASYWSDTILDPFMGSGTTLVAAKNLGRKAIGIEIEERYCEIAAKRLSQEVFSFEGEIA
jgi:DNA modification methylase